MKLQRNTLILLISLTLFVILPALAQAANPRLRLETNEQSFSVNQEMTVDVFVEDAASVYGTEVSLLFDPAVLEVVSINHGDFLSDDPDNQAFILQNEADNDLGRVNYALSLLNPAPPVDGSGLLLQITFQIKAEGDTQLQFENGLFGTQTGEEISPALEGLNVTIGSNAPAAQAEAPQVQAEVSQPAVEARPEQRVRPAETAEDNSTMLLGLGVVVGTTVILVIALIGVILLIALWMFLNRSKQKNRPARS